MDKALIKLINKATYISFDIFDTAILRRILYPEDIFDLISFNIPECENFKEVRIKSECIARKNISKLNKNGDITLDDIYKYLQNITVSDDTIIENLKNLEIETELDVCRQNEYIHDIYRYCLEKNKKIIFTSDMYLPYNTIEKILADNGYTEFHRLFLSSHHNLTKTSGELFNLVINELACKPYDILHIGDNYRSDVINPWKKGLLSYYYEKPLNRALQDKEFNRLFNMFPERDINISIYLASIVNKYYSERNNKLYEDKFWYDLGYKTSGILYLGLTLWLIDRMKKNNGEKLYLLSRDGYVIKKIYDLIGDKDKALPPAEYLYSSRRAFYIPSITKLDDETLNFLTNPLCNDLSVAQYLERIELNPDLYKDKIVMAGFSSKESRVKTDGDYKKLKQLFIMLEEDILKQSGKERDILVKYFLQCDLLNNKVINIFDLGWYGSIQRGLKKLVNLINDKDITVKGYYLGTHPVSSDLNTESYIINCGYPEEQFRILHSNTKVLESFFNAPHGSVLGFYEENNEIKPLCDDIKFEAAAIEKMSVLQKGAIDFAIDFLYLKNKFKSIQISKYLAISPMIRLLNKPTCSESIKIGDLEHFDAFGKISMKRYIAKPSLSLLSFFLNPIQFLQNFRYNKITYWKTGYIKRLSRSDLILELAKNLWYNSTCIKKFIYKKFNK